LLEFLRSKLKTTSFFELFIGELEALIVGLVGGIPTVFGMLIRNAVYRMLGMKIKGFCWIQPRVTIVNLRRLRVGRHFGCNSGSYINAIGSIEMGDEVLIGSNVTISSGKHPIEGRDQSVFSRPVIPMPISIGNDVWFGAGSSVMPGVEIATGTVVGANAVVTKNTALYAVVAGVPARTIKFR
jgi:acetyltransferase-like isoleucine patch superfamily enzyme